jgi:hypothetical protein
MVSADGTKAICPRTESSVPAGDAGYIHYIDVEGGPPAGVPYGTSSGDTNRDFTLATTERRHFTYLTLLDNLTLSPGHRANLLERGLTDSVIDFNRYRSLPGGSRLALAAKVAAEGLVAGVPGFYKGDKGIDLVGAAGLLVPVLNLEREVIAIQVRRDAYDGKGGKYVWISSSGWPYGAGPGAPVHVAMPDELTTTEYVFVTEGPLKADVIAHYTGAITLGIPGVSMWRKAVSILATLLPLNVVLAFDNDRHSNPTVERHYEYLRQGILDNHFNAYVALWDTRYKGLDDWLVATGGRETLKFQVIYKASLDKAKTYYKESLAKSYKTESALTWSHINSLKSTAPHITGPDHHPPFAIPGCGCEYCVATREWFAQVVPA